MDTIVLQQSDISLGETRPGVSKHPERLKQLQEMEESTASSIANASTNALTGLDNKVSYFYKPKVVGIHGWMDLVVSGLLPFSIVENRTYRNYVRHPTISKSTLKKYMSLLTRRVEGKIKNKLPEKFALAFDGWSEGDTHYVAIFASIPYDNDMGYKTFLLGFSPFEDEISQDANHHKAYSEFVLELLGKSYDNVVALLDENCSTNQSFAGKVQTPLVGCASHRFNLAVQDIIQTKKTIVQKVNGLMKKLRNPIPAPQLHKWTNLRAKCNNATRWSSTAEMFRKYQQIKEFLSDLDLFGLDDFIPIYREEKQIGSLCDILLDLDSVTKALQRDSITVAEARVLFDAVITKYPDTKCRLSTNASIVRDPHFEAGIIKIQEKKSGSMTRLEKEATESLKQIASVSEGAPQESEETLSFADEVLKKRKICTNLSSYIDIRFILPTANIVERFFSKAGYSLSQRRKRLTPANLEMQLFLHMNSDLWSIQDVYAIVE